MNVVRFDDGSVAFVCSRPAQRAATGRYLNPHDCPIGLDPRHCDEHTRKPQAFDARFLVCINTDCGWEGMAKRIEESPKPESAPEHPITAGDVVRIHAAHNAAYAPVYRGARGKAVSVQQYRTGVRRWLVDYGCFGRYQVREEHLVRVGPESESKVST